MYLYYPRDISDEIETSRQLGSTSAAPGVDLLVSPVTFRKREGYRFYGRAVTSHDGRSTMKGKKFVLYQFNERSAESPRS
jgi:hypothetical protein